jgi:hypothetical protein
LSVVEAEPVADLNNQDTIANILRQFGSLATRTAIRADVAVLRATVTSAIGEIASLPGGATALCAVVRGIALGIGFGFTGGLPVDAIITAVIQARLIALSLPCP